MTAENELAKRLLNPRPAEESSEGAKLGSWMFKKKVWGKGKRKRRRNLFKRCVQICGTWEKWEKLYLENPGEQISSF